MPARQIEPTSRYSEVINELLKDENVKFSTKRALKRALHLAHAAGLRAEDCKCQDCLNVVANKELAAKGFVMRWLTEEEGSYDDRWW